MKYLIFLLLLFLLLFCHFILLSYLVHIHKYACMHAYIHQRTHSHTHTLPHTHTYATTMTMGPHNSHRTLTAWQQCNHKQCDNIYFEKSHMSWGMNGGRKKVQDAEASCEPVIQSSSVAVCSLGKACFFKWARVQWIWTFKKEVWQGRRRS